MITYGRCEHIVDIPSIWSYLSKELLGIFYILQYLNCIIYIVAQHFFSTIGIMLGLSLITSLVNYVLLRNNIKKIKELAERVFTVSVHRDGRLQEVNSTELVPGDIFVPHKGP